MPCPWITAVPREAAIKDSDFFANQNSAVRLAHGYTLKRLADAFNSDKVTRSSSSSSQSNGRVAAAFAFQRSSLPSRYGRLPWARCGRPRRAKLAPAIRLERACLVNQCAGASERRR